MARLPRVVIPNIPHHVTQRGNRRQRTFFSNGDYALYLSLMAGACECYGVEILAYCLMPNHVHLIAVPQNERSLAWTMGEAHRAYTTTINRRNEWKGHLWQGRFFSTPMDGAHLLGAARYVEMNPVRAGLVADPFAWRWSSAVAHRDGRDDRMVRSETLRAMVGGWEEFLTQKHSEDYSPLRRATSSGRPLGNQAFIKKLEALTGRPLTTGERGPKGK